MEIYNNLKKHETSLRNVIYYLRHSSHRTWWEYRFFAISSLMVSCRTASSRLMCDISLALRQKELREHVLKIISDRSSARVKINKIRDISYYYNGSARKCGAPFKCKLYMFKCRWWRPVPRGKIQQAMGWTERSTP